MTNEELEKIYNEAYRAVYWTAMSLLKNEADAEDIVQDAFVAFIESYSDIKDTSKATALLKKIAANKCLNRLKLTKTDNVEDEFFESVEAVPEDFLPDTIVESAEMRKIVMDIINNLLSEDVRRTLILFYFDEMSTKEIAELLGIPQGTVLWRLNFAKKKIKKEVEKYEEDNDTKLFGMAIPFLSKLFTKESEQVVFKPMPASLANLSASAEASGKGVNIKASKEAVKKGTDIMKTKILIGCIAGIVVVSVTVGIIVGVVSKAGNSKDGEVLNTVIEENKDNASGNNPVSSNTDESSGVTSSEASSFNENISISFDGMSVDEIIADIDSMRTITSSSIYDYPNRFSLTPTDTDFDSIGYAYWWKTSYADYADNPEDRPDTYMNMSAYVELLILAGIDVDSDGEITITDDGHLSLLLQFKDLDTAKAVYDAVISKFFNEEGFQEKSDESGWYASCYGNDIQRGSTASLLLLGFDGPLEVYALEVTVPLVDRTH